MRRPLPSPAPRPAQPSFHRSQWNRLLELDDRIRRGEYPTCGKFAEEWEVSRRTILRDIEFLRMRGAPLGYDSQRRGFYYETPSWRLPALDLTEGELLQLAVIQRLAGQYQGTPLADTLDQLFAKLRAALPERISVDPLLVDRGFSFYGQPARPITEKVWRTLAQAIRERRSVRASYRAFGRRKPREADFEPLHLACVQGEWYAVLRWPKGWLGHFAVSRFERLRILSRTFDRGDFDPDAYFRNRFGRFVGQSKEEVEVVVRFDKELAEAIQERRWHDRQKVKRRRDGSVVVSFPVPPMALLAVRAWALQWGAAAHAMAPPQLIADIAAEVRKMVATRKA